MRKQIFIAISLFLLGMPVVRAQMFKGVENLIDRRITWLKSKVQFKQIAGKNGKDTFTLRTLDNTLFIEATSPSAAAMAVNWYLKYYARQMITLSGDNVRPLPSLPQIKKKEIHTCWAEKRYALNYCTFNYTMSFWGWKEWEKELDWMALNGVNIALTLTGVEEVWYNILKQLSFTDKEIDEFIPGPAFHAWWLMGNLEGWGGPLPERMRKDKVVLQQKIIKRIIELGIEPELHGFMAWFPDLYVKSIPMQK